MYVDIIKNDGSCWVTKMVQNTSFYSTIYLWYDRRLVVSAITCSIINVRASPESKNRGEWPLGMNNNTFVLSNR